jgi:hypothetical protein
MGKGKFTQELFDDICNEIAYSDRGLVSICKDKDLNANSFYEWLSKDKNLGDKYARARELQAEYLADQIIEIADDGTNDYMTIVKGDVEYNVEDKEVTNRSKLRVDARKWKASKLAPKKYGDKLDIEATVQSIKVRVTDNGAG